MSGMRRSRYLLHNATRNMGRFASSAFGILIGIAALTFILALSSGVRGIVLGELFPIERVKVVAPKTAFMGKDTSIKLTDDIVNKIKAHPGVKSVVPRMEIAFPSKGHGWFEDTRLDFELVGDGVSTSYAEEKHQELFKDWETAEDPATLPSCAPNVRNACSGLRYCDQRDFKCHHRVPILISRFLVSIYNTQLAESRGLPVIGGFEEFVVARGGLAKMRVYIDLGDSMAAIKKPMQSPPRRVEGVILGISDRAVDIGLTVPIGYVKRWNEEYVGTEAGALYSSIIVELESKDDVAEFGAWVQKDLNLRLADSLGEALGQLILGVTLILILISFVIIIISAIHIAHSFFLQVSERRREIGVLRAIGARKGDIRMLILGEAALIGVISGALGVALAWLGALGLDAWVDSRWPHFPFESIFSFRWWILVGGLGFAVLFCILGGLLPATRAAAQTPAQALTAR